MTVSNGSTGRSGSGQVPTGSTPHGQSNGAPNGRGGGREELTAARDALPRRVPVFLKIAYHGPAAMEELATYDPLLVPGILGGASGGAAQAHGRIFRRRAAL